MMHNLSARQMNANATREEDALFTLQVGSGEAYALGAVLPSFPATWNQMANLTVPAATGSIGNIDNKLIYISTYKYIWNSYLY